MKVLPTLIILVGIIGGGAGLYSFSKQGVNVTTRQEITASIAKQISGLKNAGIKEVDCKAYDGGLKSEGAHCYFSPLEPDQLLPLIQKAMEPLGHTNGWTNDYSVWGAFYASAADPKRSFGVNISPVQGNRDFEGVDSAKGFKSFVNFIVNSTRVE